VDKITLSVDLVNAMLGSLGRQPFVEVQGIINAVQQEAANQFPAVEQTTDQAAPDTTPDTAPSSTN
jgi:hypothetical protein